LQGIRIGSDGKHRKPFDPEKPLTCFHHSSIPALIAAGIISQQWLTARWTFAFVRNPWDRLVSLYAYLFHVLGRHKLVYGDLSFVEFVRIVTDTEAPIDPVGVYNWQGLSQARPQTEWLTHWQGRRFVDYVGRFEHLDDDWAHVAVHLGIDTPLPYSNSSPRQPRYQDYYDEQTRALVARYYAADIQLGGYSYDPV